MIEEEGETVAINIEMTKES